MVLSSDSLVFGMVMQMLNFSLELRTYDEKVHLEELKLKNKNVRKYHNNVLQMMSIFTLIYVFA